MYTPKQYAAALHQVISDTNPKDHDRVIDNFSEILLANGDLGRMDEIEVAYLDCDRQARGVKLAEVSSAKELSGAEEAKIIRELNEHVGGQVELRKKIDEGLIGGVVIKIEDELIDGSIKKTLQDLKDKLIND